MQTLHKFFVGLIVIYVGVMLVGITLLRSENDLLAKAWNYKVFATDEDVAVSTDKQAPNKKNVQIKKLQQELAELKELVAGLQAENKLLAKGVQKTPKVEKKTDASDNESAEPKKKDFANPIAKFFGQKSPLGILGAYPDVSHVFKSKPKYDVPHLGIINQDDYCDRADLWNLAHEEVLFEQRNFFTDYPGYTLPRREIMKPTGTLVMPHIAVTMPVEDFESRRYKLKYNINNYFNNFRGAMDYYHEVGKHFACATQMYNHIPGHGFLIQKDSLLDSFRPYVARYAHAPQCFNETSYFLPYFRLYDKQECTDFFKLIHSQEYKKSLEEKPIQYLVKIGRGSHKGQGVFILDNDQANDLDKEYNFGKQCGSLTKSLIVQGYVANPLLLDLGNKFDFRLYGLVASTNPLIMYYHDGFLRVSLNKFDTKSSDKATHLTNTFLANQKIEDAKQEGRLINGMTEQELLEYHLWSFERLQSYLLSIGRITDKNWLNNYLRPAIHKAIIHVMKMTSHGFLKHSNLYELHGLDFILDNDMKIWFIEANPSPLLTGTTKHMVYHETIKHAFDIMYAYYRSRMLRFSKLIKEMMKDPQALTQNLPKWKADFQVAARNKLEPEHPVPKDNSYTLIMDEGLEGEKAYFGLIDKECVLKN